MAKLVVVAVSDRAVGAFMRPFCAPSKAAGVRAFADEVNRPESELGKHPRDYELHMLAEFDDHTGVFTSSGAELLMRAVDCLEREVEKGQLEFSEVIRTRDQFPQKGNGGVHDAS